MHTQSPWGGILILASWSCFITLCVTQYASGKDCFAAYIEVTNVSYGVSLYGVFAVVQNLVVNHTMYGSFMLLVRFM